MPWKDGFWVELVHDNYMGVAACGAKSLNLSKLANNVTCPTCSRLLKMSHWFCEEHGFIADEMVTNDERCLICNRCAKGHI